MFWKKIRFIEESVEFNIPIFNLYQKVIIFHFYFTTLHTYGATRRQGRILGSDSHFLTSS